MSDFGSSAVDDVFRRAQIDQEWSLRREGGFEWWGHHLCQAVWSEGPTMSQGMEVTELRAETTILRDLNLGQRTTALVAELNKHATLSSFIVDEERAELRYQTRLYTHFAVHTLAKELFLHTSVLQVAEAHRRMDSLSEHFESPIAVSNHPDMQIPDEPDGMLAVIDDVCAPQGTRESPWPDEEFSLSRRWIPVLR